MRQANQGRARRTRISKVLATALVGAAALVGGTDAAQASHIDITVDFDVNDKVYDGTDDATLTYYVAVGVDPLHPDVGLLYTADFSDKNAGAGKTVNVSFTLVGPDAFYYTVTNANTSGTADIFQRPLTPTVIVDDKVYDGTAAITSVFFGPDDRIPGDAISLDSSTPRDFDSRNAGPRIGTINGIVIRTGMGFGADGANYYLTTTTASDPATIFQRAITVTAAADSKQYDGTTTSSGVPTVTFGAIAPGDSPDFTQTFDTKHAGTGKTLTPAGSVNDGNMGQNYAVTFAPVMTGTISTRPLNVSVTADDKEYDGTTAAVAHLFDDRLMGDDLDLTYAAANFVDPFVGNGKTVNVTGIAIVGGSDQFNYHLANTSAQTTADITSIFRLDPADQVYDAAAGAFTSLYAGPTSYLFPVDIDEDGRPDLVNATTKGIQIFHNDGFVAGHQKFTLVQEIEAAYGKGGGAIDVVADGDLDLVVGAVTTMKVLLNDGTGVFSEGTPVTHGFAVPTVAVPFNSKANPAAFGNKIRAVLCASADSGIAADLIGPSADGKPHLYVLEYNGATWTRIATLDPFNLDGVAFRDVDGDGETDIIASNRSGVATMQPVYIYRSNGGGYTSIAGIDFSTFTFPFSFGPTEPVNGEQWNQPVEYDGFAVGSWHRFSVYQRTGGTSFAPPVHVSADPGYSQGYNIAEAFASSFADIDGDGDAELLGIGRFVPLFVANLAGDPNAPANRYATAPVGGTYMDMAAVDWDNDGNDAPDVIVGGSNGIFYYHNPNGGTPDAGGPVIPPPPPTPGEILHDVHHILYAALDPHAADPLGADVPTYLNAANGQSYYDFVQTLTHNALGELAGIDPAYYDVPNFVFGNTNADKIETLRGYYGHVSSAIIQLAIASVYTTDPDDLTLYTDVIGRLLQAQAGIVQQGQALGGVGAPFSKRAGKKSLLRQAQRVRTTSLREQQTMLDAMAHARQAADTTERQSWIKIANRAGANSLRAMERYIDLSDRLAGRGN